MNYMGVDHHRQYSHVILLDEKGRVVKSGRMANLRRELENFICGVNGVTAVVEAGRSSYTMVAVEMGDLRRFEDVRKFHAYSGVIPSTHSSGETTYHGKIIKAGNRWLRWRRSGPPFELISIFAAIMIERKGEKVLARPKSPQPEGC